MTSHDTAPRRSPARRTLIVATPILFAGLTLLHPVEDPWELGDALPRWMAVHVGQVVLTIMLAYSVWMLLDGLSGRGATVARAALPVFLVAFSAFDAVAGIATGWLALRAEDQTGEARLATLEAIEYLFADNWLAGNLSILGGLTAISWMTLAIAAAVALRLPAPTGSPSPRCRRRSSSAPIPHPSAPSDCSPSPSRPGGGRDAPRPRRPSRSRRGCRRERLSSPAGGEPQVRRKPSNPCRPARRPVDHTHVRPAARVPRLCPRLGAGCSASCPGEPLGSRWTCTDTDSLRPARRAACKTSSTRSRRSSGRSLQDRPPEWYSWPLVRGHDGSALRRPAP